MFISCLNHIIVSKIMHQQFAPLSNIVINCNDFGLSVQHSKKGKNIYEICIEDFTAATESKIESKICVFKIKQN